MGSQSTNVGICVRQIHIKEFMDSELHVVKWVSITKGSFKFREKSIVKLSFYLSEFVVLRIV